MKLKNNHKIIIAVVLVIGILSIGWLTLPKFGLLSMTGFATNNYEGLSNLNQWNACSEDPDCASEKDQYTENKGTAEHYFDIAVQMDQNPMLQGAMADSMRDLGEKHESFAKGNLDSMKAILHNKCDDSCK